MTCIHGLDEINCPACRIISFTAPKNPLNNEKLRINNLKSLHPFLRQNLKEKAELLEEVAIKKMQLNPNIPGIGPDSSFNIKLPDFKNKMFFKRLDEIDISKSDKLGIPKKTSLENPILKHDEED